MTAARLDADVVICGAGVAGLGAACALGRLGLTVELLEKTRQPPPVPKGEVLQPGSLDVLQAWAVLPALEARGAVRLSRLVARTAAGTELLAMDFSLLGAERPWMLAHDYATILECLGSALGPTVRWQRGARVSALLRDAGGRVAGVRATRDGRDYEVRARLVVAADGMSSRLRALAGMTAAPVPYGHRLLAAELSVVAGGPGEVCAYVTGRGLLMTYPLPGGRTRVYVQVAPDELRNGDRTRLRRWCDELVADVPGLAPLAAALPAGLDRRQLLKVWRYRAPSLMRPGIVLLGESAHGFHPLAAQGMNAAIGDAGALAAQLALLAGGAGNAELDRALRAYEAERLGRIRDIGVMSHNAARMMTSTSRAGRLLGRRLLRRTGRSQRLRGLLTYNMSGLGLRPLGPLERLMQLGVLPGRQVPQPAIGENGEPEDA